MTIKSLKKETVEYLTTSLKAEYMAHLFYSAAANWCDNMGYEGAAKFFRGESSDELSHAQKLQKYASGWGVNLEMPQTDKTPKIESYPSIFEKAYDMEVKLLKKYEEDAYECFDMQDLATYVFMQDFIKIQTDAVIEYATKLNELKLITSGEGIENYFMAQKQMFHHSQPIG